MASAAIFVTMFPVARPCPAPASQLTKDGWLAAFVLQVYRLKDIEEMTMSGDKNFDRSTLEHALTELGQRAFAAGRTVEEIFSNLDIDQGNDPTPPLSSPS